MTVHHLAAHRLLAMALALFCGSCSRSNTVTVTTDPPGATITVNGKVMGQAPVSFVVQEQATDILVQPALEAAGTVMGNGEPRTLKTVRTAYIPLTAYLPLYVALERNYFERFGVRVEASEAASPNDILTAIASGKLDFAAALAYTILFPGAGRYPDTFALFLPSEETSTHYTSSVISRKGSPLNSYEDLRGARIGVYQGLVQVVFLKAMLHGMNIDPSQVRIVEINPRLQIQGLVANSYDALSTTEPTVNTALAQGLAQLVVANPRVRFIMNPFPSTATAVATKLIEEEPDTAKGVVAALNLAVDFIRQDAATAKSYLPKYTPIPEEVQAQVLQDLKLFRYCKLGEENRLNVQRFADYLFENKLLDRRIPDVNVLFGDYEPPER